MNSDYYKDQNVEKNITRFSYSSAYIQTPKLGISQNEFKEALCYKGIDKPNGISWHKDGDLKYNYMMRAVVAVDYWWG